MIDEKFVIVGVVISFLGVFSYFLDTLKGKVQPNRVSFFLWSIAPLIAFFAEIKQGVGIQSLMTLSTGVFPMLILLATYISKSAQWKISKFDLLCGLISILGLILWQITKVGNIAIFFSILADGMAAVPTIKKSFTNPESESGWPWICAGLSAFFTLLTIKDWNFANYSFPLYILIVNFLIFLLVQFKLGKKR